MQKQPSIEFPIFTIANLPLTDFGDLFSEGKSSSLSLADLKVICDHFKIVNSIRCKKRIRPYLRAFAT